MTVALVCSNRPKPSVQKGCKGNQHWARDVFHAAGDAGKTLCGIPSADWLTLEPRTEAEAIDDRHLCHRCALKLNMRANASP